MKNIYSILSMKKFGSNKSVLLSILLVLVCCLSVSAQNILCKDNQAKEASLFIEVPLREVYYVNYEVIFEDSSQYIIAKTIDTNSVESVVSKLNESIFLQGAKLKFNRRISFEKNLKKYSVVKYTIVKADGSLEKKMIQLLASESGWQEVGLSANQDIVYILNTLTAKGFWCFYKNNEDQPCPVIGGLKLKTKNFDGTLNMNKLASVVRQNYASLKSYID